MLQHGNLGLPGDENLLCQFRNHTVDLSRGRPKYSKFDAHIVDAARCLVYAVFRDRFQESANRRDRRSDADDCPPFVCVAGVRMRDRPPDYSSRKLKFRVLNVR